ARTVWMCPCLFRRGGWGCEPRSRRTEGALSRSRLSPRARQRVPRDDARILAVVVRVGKRLAGGVGVVRRRLVRVERHPLGPRVFLCGVRWHDWHLGLFVLCGLGIGFVAGVVHDTLPSGLAVLAGVWLIA